jgi:hypothetical protein
MMKPFELARNLKGEVSQNVIYDFLKGKTDIRLSSLMKIMASLGMDYYLLSPYESGWLRSLRYRRSQL